MNPKETVKTTADIRAQVLCTPDEAARLLSIGRTKIFELKARGAIPFKQIDSMPMFRVKDLEKFAEDPSASIGEKRIVKRAKPKRTPKS